MVIHNSGEAGRSVAGGGLGSLDAVIDVNDLRLNPEQFRASQRARRADESLVDAVLAADARRRESVTAYETLRAEQNAFGKKVARAQGEQKQALLAEVKELAVRVKEAQAAAEAARARQDELVSVVDNLVLEGVPVDLADRAVIYNPAYTLVP